MHQIFLFVFQLTFNVILTFSPTQTTDVSSHGSIADSLNATSDLNEGIKLNTRLLANKKKLTANIVMISSSFITNRLE